MQIWSSVQPLGPDAIGQRKSPAAVLDRNCRAFLNFSGCNQNRSRAARNPPSWADGTSLTSLERHQPDYLSAQ
ncbi:hypothetical protein RE6C_05323 [Rhodopirellula europaea 6C]|uniref:Uncharacterized protein n=1 Tax=Rhodopirellula europaea 6C TaxID=1263867 RepID=M2A3U9_9BACT|nr:hypothetical protein RE6C_05323 [Rhodopirellula europaea 6C]